MFSKIQNLIKKEKNKDIEEKKSTQDETKSKISLPKNLNFTFNYNKPILKDFLVPNLKTVYYFPSLIDEETQILILDSLYSEENQNKWVQLNYSARRLQKYGGEVSPDGLRNKEELPDFLQKLAHYLMNNELFPHFKENSSIKLNHCLVNEYPDGIGIMPHTDGPLYYPYVMILSLGSYCSFNFYEDYAKYKNEEPVGKLLIEPRSLLIFTEDCYSKLLHCIEDKKNDSLFIKWDNEKKCIINCNYDNITLTDYWKGLDKEKINQTGFVEDIFPRNKRLSITIRHVPEKI